MVGGITTRGTVLIKGRSIRKVENHCPEGREAQRNMAIVWHLPLADGSGQWTAKILGAPVEGAMLE